MRELLETGVAKHSSLKETASAIFDGSSPIPDFDPRVISRMKAAFKKVLSAEGLPEKTSLANSPIDPALLWGWAEFAEDPDGKTLASWIQRGAPLGFDEAIECNGVFPKATGLSPVDSPTDAELARPLEGWSNWPSATEEQADLHRLVRESESKGFCRVVRDDSVAKQTLGQEPILNKLGVVVKFTGTGSEMKKKSRIIWDMRESKVNDRCDPAERIVLPRLMDIVLETVSKQRNMEQPTFAAVDIQDAFHNIPSGADKKYTAAKAGMEDGVEAFIIYDVLVFGSKSSPTVWGRYAAYLGRILCSVIPEIEVQIYVDDPIFILPNDKGQAVHLFTLSLLLFKIFGFPVKLEKADAGNKVKWIGASLEAGEDGATGPFVEVTIPEEKVEKLLSESKNFLKAPVVGVRQLRSYAGSMAFVAGLVPVLRPFLSPLWAALSKGAANDGDPGRTGNAGKSRVAGKLVHTKRIAASLHWVIALLQGEHGRLKRRFEARKTDEGWEIITDACPWGIGGILYKKSIPQRWFSAELSSALLEKFKAKKGESGFNTAWEALALLTALRLWLPRLPKMLSVRVKSDNVGALRMLLNLTSSSDPLSIIAREVALDIASDNYQISELEHVPGITNVAADALSRLWAPQSEPLPNLGEAVQDLAPDFSSDFWKV